MGKGWLGKRWSPDLFSTLGLHMGFPHLVSTLGPQTWKNAKVSEFAEKQFGILQHALFDAIKTAGTLVDPFSNTLMTYFKIFKFDFKMTNC